MLHASDHGFLVLYQTSVSDMAHVREKNTHGMFWMCTYVRAQLIDAWTTTVALCAACLICVMSALVVSSIVSLFLLPSMDDGSQLLLIRAAGPAYYCCSHRSTKST